jgi:hypothetical protein
MTTTQFVFVDYVWMTSSSWINLDHAVIKTQLQTNHGGVAIMSGPNVKQTLVSLPFEPKSFESVCSFLSCGTVSYTLLLMYRTGPVSTLFFDELSQILNCISTKAHPIFLAGDLNIHV